MRENPEDYSVQDELEKLLTHPSWILASSPPLMLETCSFNRACSNGSHTIRQPAAFSARLAACRI